jgi:hypothetical protein
LTSLQQYSTAKQQKAVNRIENGTYSTGEKFATARQQKKRIESLMIKVWVK